MKINADSELGIESVHWIERPPQHSSRRLECASFFDEKPPLLWVEENSGADNWYRDNLYDSEQKPVPLSEDMGKIFGMDATQDRPQLIYFGNSSSCVHRLDLKHPDEKPLVSHSLGSGIYDVLIVPHPDEEKRQAMLVATDSGHIFCLEDKGEQLSILHYQSTGEHFKQLLGCGGGDILALDHYNNPIPLRLGRPKQFIKLQNGLTDSLFGHPKIKSLFKNSLGILLKTDSRDGQAERLVCLAMELTFNS